jgi:GTP-binding protein HflX
VRSARREERERRGEGFDPRDSERTEIAIIVGLRLPQATRADCEESLEELASLAEASGARVVDRVLQSRTRVDGRTFIGAGKAAELKDLAESLGANLIVIDHDLSPAQARNLEELTARKVLDRTELILDIFARRARTPVAKQQVEIAQLEYLLPRLTRLWEHLSRTGGGIGTRGPGETQLEVDRRRVRQRLTELKRRLTQTGERKERQRGLHPGLFRVALVGYTNTGKSSLMNQLTTAGVDSRDRLFETLDATTRVLELGSGYRATLTDTVGFVRRLPHTLVESFRATLAEVASADLLLHVVDVAAPSRAAREHAVEVVLREIGAESVPRISVWNKADLLAPIESDGVKKATAGDPDVVVTSAARGEGLDELREAICRHIRTDWIEVRGTIPSHEGEVLARLRAAAELLDEREDEGMTTLRLRIPPSEWERLRDRYAEKAPALFGATPTATDSV